MSQIWIRQAGKVFGPFELAQVRQLGATGKIGPDDGISKSAEGPWTPAKQVKGLLGAPAAPAPAAPAPAPTPVAPRVASALQPTPRPTAPQALAPLSPASPAQPVAGLAPLSPVQAGLSPLAPGLAPLTPAPGGLAPLPPAGTAPAGLAPIGLTPIGLAPAGLAPAGLAPAGLAPAGLAPLGSAAAADPFGGLGPAPADPFGGLAPLAPASPAPAPRSAPKGAGKRSGSRGGGLAMPLLIGGGVLAVLLVGGAVVALTMFGGGSRGADGNVVDMTYLLDDPEMLAYAEVGEVISSPLLKPMFDQLKATMPTPSSQEMQPEDLISITVGASLGPNQQPDQSTMVMVMRTRKVIAIEPSMGAPREHNGVSYYVPPNGFTGPVGFAVFFPEQTTAVVAQEERLKQVISAGNNSPRRPQFDFVPRGRNFFTAFVPKSRSPFQQVGAALPMVGQLAPDLAAPAAELGPAISSELSGVALSLHVDGNDLSVQIDGGFQSSGSGGTARKALQSILDKGKAQLAGLPMIPANVRPIADNLQVGGSGSTATVSTKIPGSVLQSAASGAASGFPIPGFPRGNPFSRMGGGAAPTSPFGAPPSPFGAPPSPFGAPSPGAAPSVSPQEAAQMAASRNNLKQIMLAMHNFHDVHNAFPPGRDTSGRDSSGRPLLSWRVHLLPYLEEPQLYNQFKLDEPWDSPHNIALLARMPRVYQRPGANAPPGKTTYLGLSGPGGIFEGGGGKRFADVRDGLSNTAVVVEVNDAAAIEWTRPDDYAFTPTDPATAMRSVWPSGAHAALGDGAVIFVRRLENTAELLHLFQIQDSTPLAMERLTN